MSRPPEPPCFNHPKNIRWYICIYMRSCVCACVRNIHQSPSDSNLKGFGSATWCDLAVRCSFTIILLLLVEKLNPSGTRYVAQMWETRNTQNFKESNQVDSCGNFSKVWFHHKEFFETHLHTCKIWGFEGSEDSKRGYLCCDGTV
jgi:hypothetical protein